MTAPLTITPQDKILEPGTPPAGATSGTNVTAVDAASAAARAMLAKNGTAVPVDQARGPDGQFIDPKRVDNVKSVPEPGQPAAPAAGQPAPAVDPNAPKVPAVPPVDETPEAKQAREAAEAAAADDEIVETPEEIAARELEERTVTLSGRNNAEFEFIAPDKETADVLRQLRNSSMRGEEITQARAEIETRGREIENLRTVAEMDPTGFLLDAAEDAPEVVDHLVLYLATRPEVFARLGPQLQQIVSNAQTRELVAAKQENRRMTMEREVAAASEERAAVRQNVEEVRTTVMSLIPAEMSDDQASVLFKDCIRDLRDYANNHGLRTLPGRDIPTLLASRLTAYGINPVEAAARAADAATRRTATPNRPALSSPRGPARPAVTPPAAKKPTGKELVLSQRRKASMATPPGGAGSPPATTPMTPPKNADGTPMGVEQRVAWHRQQVAAGSRRL